MALTTKEGGCVGAAHLRGTSKSSHDCLLCRRVPQEALWDASLNPGPCRMQRNEAKTAVAGAHVAWLGNSCKMRTSPCTSLS